MYSTHLLKCSLVLIVSDLTGRILNITLGTIQKTLLGMEAFPFSLTKSGIGRIWLPLS